MYVLWSDLKQGTESANLNFSGREEYIYNVGRSKAM